jgi:hypothetical protein
MPGGEGRKALFLFISRSWKAGVTIGAGGASKMLSSGPPVVAIGAQLGAIRPKLRDQGFTARRSEASKAFKPAISVSAAVNFSRTAISSPSRGVPEPIAVCLKVRSSAASGGKPGKVRLRQSNNRRRPSWSPTCDAT